jgi:Response regulator of the LytR/AlgR family
MLEQLPEDRFIQVHKSYVVALSKIESIERNRINISGKCIPVGDLYKKRFYERIEKL